MGPKRKPTKERLMNILTTYSVDIAHIKKTLDQLLEEIKKGE